MRFLLGLCTAWVLFSNSFASAHELIISALPGGSVKAIESATATLWVTSRDFVFSPTERVWLKQQGRSLLSEARKVTVASPLSAIEMRHWVKREGLKLSIDESEVPVDLMQEYIAAKAFTASKFEDMQWALRNKGQSVPIELDDLTSHFVQGIPGEDIGLDRSPAENMDPARQIKIGVLDSGIFVSHEQFTDRILEKKNECVAFVQYQNCLTEAKKRVIAERTAAVGSCDARYKNLDMDGNGYPMDCIGWNVTEKGDTDVWGNNNPEDTVGHGTHVSGEMAANNVNGDGIRGGLQNVRLIPVKVVLTRPNEPVRLSAMTDLPSPRSPQFLTLSTSTDGFTARQFSDGVARGLLYALRSGSQIINMSLGWPSYVNSNILKEMLDLADSRGVLVVAAAGNDSTNALVSPCSFDTVICVGAHDPDGALSHFSNYGPGVDVAAPGLGILSLFPKIERLRPRIFTERAGYEMKNGTSMATPYVSVALGRLLNAGYSPQEAKARLLLGTRDYKPNPRVPRVEERRIQTGNIDIGRAFQVAPQPLILPTSKLAVEIPWNRTAKSATFELPLRNLWADASSVEIELKLTGNAARDARLSPTVVSFKNWKSGEKRQIPLELQIVSDRLESEFAVAMTIRSTNASTKETKTENRLASLEVTTSPQANDPEIQTMPIVGPNHIRDGLKGTVLRSVNVADGRPEQDYIAVHSSTDGLRMVLIAMENNQMELRGLWQGPALPVGATIVDLQRVDLDGDNRPEYVVITRLPPRPKEVRYPLSFRFFDSALRPITQTYDRKTDSEAIYLGTNPVTLPEEFRWMQLGNRKVPAWISRGTTPYLELPKFDPWNTTPEDLPTYRLYYWDTDGVKSIIVKDRTPIQIFQQSRTTQRSNRSAELEVLWIKGEGTDASFTISKVANGESTDEKPFNFEGFRRFKPEVPTPVLNLSPRGSALAGETDARLAVTSSYRQAARATAYNSKGLLFDTMLKPLAKIDIILSVTAGYVSDHSYSLLAQGIYDLQYHDLTSGEVASSSMKRFNMLTEFASQNTIFWPAVADDRTGQRPGSARLAATYPIAGIGGSRSVEILVPRYENGKLEGLIRPARLRMQAPEGCAEIDRMLSPTEMQPSRLGFVCRDRFLFLPLAY